MNCPRCGETLHEGRVRVARRVVLAVYALGVMFAWEFGGSLLHDVAEGGQRSLLPLWKLWLTVAVLWSGALAQRLRWRRMLCDNCAASALPPLLQIVPESATAASIHPTRRAALRVLGGALTVAAATVAGLVTAVARNRRWIGVGRTIGTPVETTAPAARPEWREARIRSYRRLGRTNAMVSDISLGSGHINDVAVARQALDRGITYFDTAPDYSDTASERVLGEAMKGRRDEVFLATKFCVRDGHLPNDTPVPKIIEAVEGSLQRLQTDHVDLIHIHSCDRLDRLMAPNIHEAFDRLKAQGKVRFLGVSTHTPNLEEVANAAIDSGRFDVMMLAYHFSMWPTFDHILEKAKAHDVGVVAMKTLKGAKQHNLDAFRDAANVYSHAAFRWVLSNPAVSCLVISIATAGHIDEYVAASGTAPQATDTAMLQRYDALTRGDYCQPHCGQCLDSCQYDLPINDILRYRMYAKDYGWKDEGVARYAALARNAAACLACPAPCAGSCPIDVPIREKMLDAHRVLRA